MLLQWVLLTVIVSIELLLEDDDDETVAFMTLLSSHDFKFNQMMHQSIPTPKKKHYGGWYSMT